jgi:predicted methyltransferase
MVVWASAVIFVGALVADPARAADIGYFAPPGAPAAEFPAPQRPVAPIVSPTRSGEERRDFLNEDGEIARILELKPGMTVGDIGAGSGYHTVRLSPRVGPTGSVIAEDVTRDYLVEPARHVAQLKLTNVVLARWESRTIRVCGQRRSTLPSSCTCITRSPSPMLSSTISRQP